LLIDDNDKKIATTIKTIPHITWTVSGSRWLKIPKLINRFFGFLPMCFLDISVLKIECYSQVTGVCSNIVP